MISPIKEGNALPIGNKQSSANQQTPSTRPAASPGSEGHLSPAKTQEESVNLSRAKTLYSQTQRPAESGGSITTSDAANTLSKTIQQQLTQDPVRSVLLQAATPFEGVVTLLDNPPSLREKDHT